MSTAEHKVGTVDELPEHGSRIIVEVQGREIAVFNLEGEYYAVLNYCVHAAGPLCEGPLAGRFFTDEASGIIQYEEGNYIQCPWHDWKFDIKTGKNVDSERYSVPTFETEVRDNDIYVQL